MRASLIGLLIFTILFFYSGLLRSADSFADSTVISKRLEKSRSSFQNLQAFVNKHDSARYVFEFNDLIYLNYQGLGDVFKLRPETQLYDFLEMGLPRFASQLNLWPQQSALFLEGFRLNDPTHGMFNLRFLFPDALQRGGSFAVNTQPGFRFFKRQIFNKQPYTRIMYREGDFGYTDLDITFARHIGARTAIQLGGINRDYGLNGYRATHYRAALTRQMGQNRFAQFFYRKSSENVDYVDYYGMDVGRFRYNEVWENARLQLLKMVDSTITDWKIAFSVSDTRRQYRFFEQNLISKIRFDRWALQAEKFWNWKESVLHARMESYQERSWGNVYFSRHIDSGVNFSSDFKGPFLQKVEGHVGLNLQYRKGDGVQVNPQLELIWKPSVWQGRLTLLKMSRFPTVHERYFRFASFRGAGSLTAEDHWRAQVSFGMAPSTENAVMVGLVFHRVQNEILLRGANFTQGADRNFAFWWTRAKYRIYRFELFAGGQAALSGQLLGPRYAGVLGMHYRDRWYKKRLLLEMSAIFRYTGRQNQLAYQPYAERFYLTGGENGDWSVFDFKATATVKDARFFMEIDNVLGLQYQIIRNYPELYRRFRFGISWVLWN